jgi:hypothetical protein
MPHARETPGHGCSAVGRENLGDALRGDFGRESRQRSLVPKALHIGGVLADLQIAILLALRERLLVPNLNDMSYLFAVCLATYTRYGPMNCLVRPIQPLPAGFTTTGSETASYL